jgi:hypothetical protein
MKIGDNIRETLLNAHPIQIRTYKYLMHPYVYIYVLNYLFFTHLKPSIFHFSL